ncbi:hypothetical protein [Lacrimispora aerotolerans]|uniref:hypothetical protein n=1 Tax=Lacrimispora aerotolerans TaxID=36832 RepID=UPI00047A3E3B|nr:hypothetical protein [Lacrimispora aerotolerans]
MKNWISEENLKRAVNEIHMDQAAKDRIIQECKGKYSKKRKNLMKLKVIVAFSVLTVILLCTPVMAQVRESLKQWLSHMTKEEIKEVYDSVQNSEGETARYSRKLSWDERLRRDQLTSLYKKGERFPKGRIKILKQVEKADPNAVIYDDKYLTWYLPSRELTDEELLEMIDYEYKESYSLDAINGTEGIMEDTVQVKAIITEEQALETAKNFIEAAYEVKPDPERMFIEENDAFGYYDIKYSGLEIKEGYRDDCSILVSSQDGKLDSVYYEDREYNASCSQTGEFPNWQVWYEKGKSILASIAGKSPIKKSYYLVYYGGDNSKYSTKKIHYFFELENGDTYGMGFLYDKGILQTMKVNYGLSYTENSEYYENMFKFNAGRQKVNYKLVEIN